MGFVVVPDGVNAKIGKRSQLCHSPTRNRRTSKPSARNTALQVNIAALTAVALFDGPIYHRRNTQRKPALTRERRKLAAIMVLDAVGYSRLMERDESGTLASSATP